MDCHAYRGLSTGIYTTNSPEACYYILENCKANIVVVENQKQLDKILEVCDIQQIKCSQCSYIAL